MKIDNPRLNWINVVQKLNPNPYEVKTKKDLEHMSGKGVGNFLPLKSHFHGNS